MYKGNKGCRIILLSVITCILLLWPGDNPASRSLGAPLCCPLKGEAAGVPLSCSEAVEGGVSNWGRAVKAAGPVAAAPGGGSPQALDRIEGLEEAENDGMQVRLAWEGFPGADYYAVYRREVALSREDCFIATAAYGSSLDPAVSLLRQFRDASLLRHETGSLLVEQYYHYSPYLAGHIYDSGLLKALTRLALLPFVIMAFISLNAPLSLAATAAAVLLYRFARGRGHPAGRVIAPILVFSLISGLFVPGHSASADPNNLTGESIKLAGDVPGLSYTDWDIVPGKVFLYRVVAVSSQGVELAEASITVTVKGGEEGGAQAGLPVVGTRENMERLLSHFQDYGYRKGDLDMPELTDGMPVEDQAPGTGDRGDPPDYSSTNVQVEGVDEADIVKTDGNHIYYIAGGRVVLVDVRDPHKPALAGEWAFEGRDYEPFQLYLDGDHLVVIGRKSYFGPPYYRVPGFEEEFSGDVGGSPGDVGGSPGDGEAQAGVGDGGGDTPGEAREPKDDGGRDNGNGTNGDDGAPVGPPQEAPGLPDEDPEGPGPGRDDGEPPHRSDVDEPPHLDEPPGGPEYPDKPGDPGGPGDIDGPGDPGEPGELDEPDDPDLPGDIDGPGGPGGQFGDDVVNGVIGPLEQAVIVVVLDITDRASPRVLRELEVEGYYNSSRKVGSSIYLVTNKSIWRPWHYYWEGAGPREKQEAYILPRVRDTAAGQGFREVGLDELHYFPGFEQANYLLLTGFSLERLEEPADISAYLGSSQGIYASRESLYVTLGHTRWDGRGIYHSSTRVFKFALEGGTIGYVARGEVPGTILNQFSMDEFRDNFRIATTTGDMWRDDEFTSKNNVYILNGDLEIIGRLEGIAPTERIYAMRFMGEKGYMVTFRQVDPFFVLDLKDPEKPEMLGYLKIPGYSDYLHPYDEDHILGFGKEVEEEGEFALDAGFKMALFDVSDVEAPVEKFKLEVGHRGTDSELLRDHRALLFSREKDIIAFPISIRERPEDFTGGAPFWGWNRLVFAGAQVYGLDLEQGFTLRGEITHLGPGELPEDYYYWYGHRSFIQRILYIGDNLYTLSPRKVEVHSLPRVQWAGELEF